MSAVGDDVVKCECNHLTHFGVLLVCMLRAFLIEITCMVLLMCIVVL